MKVSLFYELALPRPWVEGDEEQMFEEHLEQLALADRLGFHAAWVTEHHFLEEYCHASAPEVFLAAASQRTSRLRLGHGIVHMLPGINHPARVAERISTLDLLSHGRVEFGTGEGSSEAELGGFVLDPGKKRAMWEEGMKVAIGCMTQTPFAGFEGEHVTMPSRNVVPKPSQRPHPPLWVACTRQSTILMAAENGLGALSFAFMGPDEFKVWVDRYYELFASSAVPMGLAANPNILCSAGGLVCAPTQEEADRRLGNKLRFFGYGIGWYYLTGNHSPGRTNLFAQYVEGLANGTVAGNPKNERNLVGTPQKLREWLRRYEQTGVDEVMFLCPPIAHEDAMSSLELFGTEVLPEFLERDVEASKRKAERMAPVIEAAMARRPPDPVADPDYSFTSVPVSWDLGTPITEIIEAMTLSGRAPEGTATLA